MGHYNSVTPPVLLHEPDDGVGEDDDAEDDGLDPLVHGQREGEREEEHERQDVEQVVEEEDGGVHALATGTAQLKSVYHFESTSSDSRISNPLETAGIRIPLEIRPLPTLLPLSMLRPNASLLSSTSWAVSPVVAFT